MEEERDISEVTCFSVERLIVVFFYFHICVFNKCSRVVSSEFYECITVCPLYCNFH